MISINISVPYSLTQQVARQRVQQFLDGLQQEYAGQIQDVHGAWDNDQLHFGFQFGGFPIACDLLVEPHQVAASSSLPLAAGRGKIESWIKDELQRRLAHSS